MRFIPLEFVVINTPLEPAEARARLAAVVAPCRCGDTGRRRRALCGTIGLAAFTLRRGTHWPGALLPEFRGRIEPLVSGARLTGIVSLEPLPVLVLAVAAMVSFWAGAGTLVGVLSGAPVQPLKLAPLGGAVRAWAFAVRHVVAEAGRLRRLVKSALAEVCT